MGNRSSSEDQGNLPEPDPKWDKVLAQSYKEIQRECSREGYLWQDPLFPAEEASLFFTKDPPKGLKWMRPYVFQEIASQDGWEPEFFNRGGSRFDLIQGELGNCWLVAAAGSLADHERLLAHVVPPGQNFDAKQGYAGIFRFRFYRYNRWVEICVDDRLPTLHGKLLFVHSPQTYEFWSSLMEKAYAKMHGSYEALESGVPGDALTDLTGGIVESYVFRNCTPPHYCQITVPENLDSFVLRAVERGSLVCAGIFGDSLGNEVLSNGLVTGHAYTVAEVRQLVMERSVVTLLRVRNPWGNQYEWRGDWSDASEKWYFLPEYQRQDMKHRLRPDGDFWIELGDFERNFSNLSICNMTPDSVEQEGLRQWDTHVIQGAWIKGRTAGGSLYSPTIEVLDSFASNPQYEVRVVAGLEDDGRGSLVIELCQKDRRKNRSKGYRFWPIGFSLYKASSELPLRTSFLASVDPEVLSDYAPVRTITLHLWLEPGRYVLIPSTYEFGQEAEFILRIWNEKKY